MHLELIKKIQQLLQAYVRKCALCLAKTQNRMSGLRVVIRNIPSTLEAIDLRVHFSTMVERGCFAKFHYLRRPELVVDSNTKQIVSTTMKCCIVELNSESDVAELIRNYHGRNWRRRDMTFLDDICIIQRVAFSTAPNSSSVLAAAATSNDSSSSTSSTFMTQREMRERIGALVSDPTQMRRESIEENMAVIDEHSAIGRVALLELSPPRTLPHGNVGTPTSFLNVQIAKCALSPAELARQGLKISELFRRKRSTNASVPLNYENLKRNSASGDDGGTSNLETMLRRGFKRRATSHSNNVDVDDDNAIGDSVAQQAPQGVDEKSDDDEPESWEIHEARYDSGSRKVGQTSKLDPGSPRYGT